ncbi:MAG: DASH family cryptochrome [Planctomycetes bacterium]|nr:DASH family cryptochrome [Planctomycetota bacterium]
MTGAYGPIAIVWHRTDLRVRDHAAVAAAAQSARGRVAGVICVPEDVFGTVDLGRGLSIARASHRRVGHWLQAIDGLRHDWRTIGSALCVHRGAPEEVIPSLAAELGATEVHTAPCPAHDELAQNRLVARALKDQGARLVMHDETTMIAATDLPFEIEELPEVFSNYRRLVERSCRTREPIAEPSGLHVSDDVRASAEATATATLASQDLDQARAAALQTDPRAGWTVRGDRAAGLERLRQWIWRDDCLSRYKETRDGLLGADFSSRLSTWLALGTLSPREVAAEVRRYEHERVANDSTYWLWFELLWRDYFHLWVRRWRSRAFKASGMMGRTPCGAPDVQAFDRWRTGTTGEPFVDACMHELAATGWMSNRGRQNAASWLAKTAGVDWRWGAWWFESQLLDYDVGPNWGNWQYVAGVGNDPRNRTFNVRAQAERYDADGAYRRVWA